MHVSHCCVEEFVCCKFGGSAFPFRQCEAFSTRNLGAKPEFAAHQLHTRCVRFLSDMSNDIIFGRTINSHPTTQSIIQNHRSRPTKMKVHFTFLRAIFCIVAANLPAMIFSQSDPDRSLRKVCLLFFIWCHVIDTSDCLNFILNICRYIKVSRLVKRLQRAYSWR